MSDAEDLLSSVRHDLANPLLAIKLNLEVLLAERPTHDRRRGSKRLDQAFLAAERAEQLVGELGAFISSRPTRGSSHVASVGSAVKEALEVLSAMAMQRKIILSAHLGDHAAIVKIPSRDLFRVLSNLVSNAIKYCDERIT